MDNSDSSAARGDRILFWKALFSGGIAGLSVDIALYPIDTVKTRIQSPQGFFRAGGFRDMYKGISVVAMGSAPGAALFFSTYESMKHVLNDRFGYGAGAAEQHTTRLLPQPAIHMLAASIGEVIACIVRVPTEVIKQRMQAGSGGAAKASMWDTFSSLWRIEGVQGLYKGFNITIMREIPFAFIQFPIYESMKEIVRRQCSREVHSYESAICGSFSGAIAAAVTTPLDVMKTRLMLGEDSHGVPYKGVVDTFTRILAEGSGNSATSAWRWRVFFRGVGPRVLFISIGGFVFFGAYERAGYLLDTLVR